MNKCVICDVETLKYKCPQCFVRYCSVSCCKAHKDKCGEAPETDFTDSDPRTSNEVTNVPNYPLWKAQTRSEQYPVDDEEDDAVSAQRLEMLRDNDQISTLLKNPHLRAICENLVNTENPSLEMAKAMQEPIFTELADQCLKVVDPNNPHLEQQEPSTDEEDE